MQKKTAMKNQEEYTYYLFLSLKQKQKEQFREDFLDLHPTDQVEVFIQMSEEKRKRVYEYLHAEEFSVLFGHLSLQIQKIVFTELEDDYALEMIKELPADELTDFFGEVPEHISAYLLGKMDVIEADNIKRLLSYQADTAGALMTTEFIFISPDATISKVMMQLREEALGAETIYYLYVTEHEKLIGVVSLRELIASDPNLQVRDIMKEQVVSVLASADQGEVSKIIKDYNLLALPVVTTEDKMLGIVTVDDVIDVLEEEATEDIGEFSAVRGALDLDVGSFEASKKRLPWLILLLFVGLVTGGLITTFEATLTQVAILAIFIPLIADMAGNTGTQSLAVVVRALAQDKITKGTIGQLLKRETMTGLQMGVVCGLIAFVIGLLIPSGSAMIGVIVGISMAATIIFSTLTGTVIPLIIDKYRIDPAVASGPFITTINDIVGLLIYFSIATLLLAYI